MRRQKMDIEVLSQLIVDRFGFISYLILTVGKHKKGCRICLSPHSSKSFIQFGSYKLKNGDEIWRRKCRGCGRISSLRERELGRMRLVSEFQWGYAFVGPYWMIDPSTGHLPKRLGSFRGISRRALAKLLGVNKNTVTRWIPLWEKILLR